MRDVSAIFTFLHLGLLRWCPKTDVGFVDIWWTCLGRPGVTSRDGIHPT